MPNIHQDSLTLTEIQQGLNAGKEVIVHTDPIQVPGWTGAGYIIFDPEDGSGAYKITGGGNGGYFLIGFAIGVSALALLVEALPLLLASFVAGELAVIAVAESLGISMTLIGAYNNISAKDPDGAACLLSGFITGITLGISALPGVPRLVEILLSGFNAELVVKRPSECLSSFWE